MRNSQHSKEGLNMCTLRFASGGAARANFQNGIHLPIAAAADGGGVSETATARRVCAKTRLRAIPTYVKITPIRSILYFFEVLNTGKIVHFNIGFTFIIKASRYRAPCLQ